MGWVRITDLTNLQIMCNRVMCIPVYYQGYYFKDVSYCNMGITLFLQDFQCKWRTRVCFLNRPLEGMSSECLYVGRTFYEDFTMDTTQIVVFSNVEHCVKHHCYNLARDPF